MDKDSSHCLVTQGKHGVLLYMSTKIGEDYPLSPLDATPVICEAIDVVSDL